MLGRRASWGCALIFALTVATPAGNMRAETATEADKLNTEASRLQDAGKYAEAVPLAQRALAIREAVLGAEHRDVGQSLNNVAELYRNLGRYAEAEPLYKRSLAIFEKALGPDHPEVGIPLNNLAVLYSILGRRAEAEPLSKRSLAIREKALGPEHPDVATSLNNLAGLYKAQGRYAEAEPLYKRSLAIGEKALGPEHPRVAVSLGNLAELYQALRRYEEAEPLYKRSLAILEKALGPEHSWVSISLSQLAGLYRTQSRYAEAELYLKRALAINEKALGPEHRDIATSLNNLAWLALAQDNLAAAADYWRRATTILQRRAERGLAGTLAASSKGEAQQKDWYFAGLIKTTRRLHAETLPWAAEMFQTAQWAVGSEAAASLAQMAARSAKGSPELAVFVRERQDLLTEWQLKDKQLVYARSEPPERRNADGERALADRLAAIDTRIAAVDARLAKDFPDYAALANPRAASVADVQAVLRDDEALVHFFDTAEFKPLPEETFIWVVTRHDVRWLRSHLGTASLRREVDALRCGLDASAWSTAGSLCAKLTGASYTGADQANGKPLPFDAARAHALYKSLFGEAEDLIYGKQLHVVPSGALTRLPFQVLLTNAPASQNLTAASWLIRKHAITVLPSTASLTALRRTNKPTAAAKSMIGFANPLLEGNQSDPVYGLWYKQQAERARSVTGCAAPTKAIKGALRRVGASRTLMPQLAGLADVAQLRKQTPLPETADEVCEVARSIGADTAEMRIGAKATEAEVKRLSGSGDLARYRVLHFATHGTLAGQLTGTREPGLILTPPAKATVEDDGYLSSSEIASLKLDSDWVILSACNTAGGAGEGEAAEALSGLARVFFYAGTRALLVSHWEIDSHAAVKLVTGAVGALAKDKSLGRAEALRRAMLTVMTDKTRPANWVPAAHPSVWAPFVVVGEGGVGR